jgi:Protein of unknown function (DUF4231)
MPWWKARRKRKNIPKGSDRKAVILQRVDEDITWYETNAKRAMRGHNILSITVLVSAGLVSIFALSPGTVTKYIAAGLGVLAGVARGLEGLHKFHEHYTDFRFTANALDRERYEYEASIGDYKAIAADAEAALEQLAVRVEAITTQAEQQWRALQDQPNGGTAGPG